uniref:ATP-dependent DNA helicase n=1 Tax=Lactuca sativa TaxID=4236 RepID=A0A9R1V3U9_LACSA|nr:hypothetical protein LSAT_V11C700371850 [Lactuca sativa]
MSLTRNGQVLAIVYGHGDTRKTFLCTTIIYAIRSKGNIVLAVIASGIASLSLDSGRTTHSRFKIPLDLTNTLLCNINKMKQLAQLLIETTLIIWDEQQ